MTVQIFVPGVGQHENIGDIILRRQLLDRVREYGTLHIYVGASTDDYDVALGISGDDVIYRSFSRWYLAALRLAAAGKASYIFKPGEIQLTLVGMKEHISMLPVAILARLRGRPVIRIGTGSRNFARVPRFLMRPSIAVSNLTLWRDRRTAEYLSAPSMPDLAFAEGGALEGFAKESDRNLLIVSMRADREETPAAWIDAVRTVADSRNLKVVAISQVFRDNPKTEELARRLGGEALTWDGNDHQAKEKELRAVYGRALLAVSDRLHVLIAAFTEGAVPVALLTDGSDKVDRHFAAAGIDGISFYMQDGTLADEASQWLDSIINRREELLAGLAVARAEISSVFDRVRALYLPDGCRRYVAYHVGRRGDVAGGMTQVMNSYLSWSFNDFAVKFIQSRGARNALFGSTLVVRAATKILFSRDVRRAVLVVHLSQGGSFLREGTLLRLGRLRGFPVVAQLHGSSFASFASKKPRLVRSVLRRAHGVHVLSEESAAIATRFAAGAVIVEIPNAVAEGALREKESLVVFGGAVSRRKGVDVLLAAWEAASDGWRLVIAGPVLEPDMLPTRLPDGVEVLGGVAHSRLMELLEHSRIAVLPSRDEAMPMFLIEAMARGNAVLSTNVGGIPTLVSEDAGVIVAPGDVDALRAALSALTNDDSATSQLQAGAQKEFRARFSADVVAPQLNAFWLAVRDNVPVR